MYVPATFVHVTIISAVTDPILSKILGPNFFRFLIFVDQHLFLGENVLDLTFFNKNNDNDKNQNNKFNGLDTIEINLVT